VGGSPPFLVSSQFFVDKGKIWGSESNDFVGVERVGVADAGAGGAETRGARAQSSAGGGAG